MNKLVVIGNGFDLQCNLSTSFNDFFLFYKTINQDPKSKNFFYFLLYETYFGKYNEEYQELLKINTISDWMDFELLLNHFLFSSSLYSIFSDFYRQKVDSVSVLDLDDYGLFAREIFKYFENKDLNPIFTKFEGFLGDELDKFELALCAYLKTTEDMQQNLNDKKMQLIQRIVGNDTLSGLITFNYTILPKLDVPISYVHGKYFNETFTPNIMTGVDPTLVGTKKADFKALKDKKIFVKTYRKMILDHDAILKNTEIFGQSVGKISFYGHSLGEQDYSYFQSIFDRYDIYGSNIILEFLYTNFDGTKNELSRTIDRVYYLINEYGNTLDNHNHGRNLLHKMMLEGRLIIKEI